MVLNSASRLEMRASIVVNAAMLRYHAIVLMFLRSKRLPDHNQVRDPCWGSRCADTGHLKYFVSSSTSLQMSNDADYEINLSNKFHINMNHMLNFSQDILENMLNAGGVNENLQKQSK